MFLVLESRAGRTAAQLLEPGNSISKFRPREMAFGRGFQDTSAQEIGNKPQLVGGETGEESMGLRSASPLGTAR